MQTKTKEKKCCLQALSAHLSGVLTESMRCAALHIPRRDPRSDLRKTLNNAGPPLLIFKVRTLILTLEVQRLGLGFGIPAGTLSSIPFVAAYSMVLYFHSAARFSKCLLCPDYVTFSA